MKELKKLYANHAPQLKPRKAKKTSHTVTSATVTNNISSPAPSHTVTSASATAVTHTVTGYVAGNVLVASSSSGSDEGMDSDESIDPVEDVYNILEGSALVPFIEVSDRLLNSCIFMQFSSGPIDRSEDLLNSCIFMQISSGPLHRN